MGRLPFLKKVSDSKKPSSILDVVKEVLIIVGFFSEHAAIKSRYPARCTELFPVGCVLAIFMFIFMVKLILVHSKNLIGF